MNTNTRRGAKHRKADGESGTAEEITISVNVPRELVEQAALMAARFDISRDSFIEFHVRAGAISTLGIASSNLGWTPEDYPFENRETALRAVRVVFEEWPSFESHQLSYLEKGKMIYEEVRREELSINIASHPAANRYNRKQEVAHV